MRFFSSLFGFNPGIRNLKKLGYPSNTRLLIVHADDMGLSVSTNLACIKAMESGIVNSGSVMMPCPFAQQIIDYSKLHKDLDIGIHLTLTSEWANLQWRPVLGNKVPSLINSVGCFFETREELERKAKISEVEQELRAQIEMAISSGMLPTHLDSHMFAGTMNPEFLKIYIQLGREYELPLLLNKEKIKRWHKYNLLPYISEKEFLVDRLYIATKRNAKKGQANYYSKILRSMKPGINCLLVHPAFRNKEMESLTQGRMDYNSDWRQADFDFFTSEKCHAIIKGENIQLITWKEIRDRSQR